MKSVIFPYGHAIRKELKGVEGTKPRVEDGYAAQMAPRASGIAE
jgi:hypothetical protein